MSAIRRLRLRPGARMRHAAMFYAGEHDYLDRVSRFIAPAIDSGAPIVMALPTPKLEQRRERLADHRDAIEFLDMAEVGANPARIIPAIEAAAEAHPGQRIHFVSESMWEERSPEEVSEVMLHEALIGRALSSAAVQLLCAYDLSTLAAPVIAAAERAHCSLWEGDGPRRSGGYHARALPRRARAPLDEPPGNATSLRFELSDLARVRALVSERASAARLSVGQCGDVVLAVSELATNSIRHGGGEGTLRTWQHNGRLTFEVSDAGRIRDPLVGRLRPAPDAPGGRGLWLVNQVCDLVQIRTGRAGTTVRIHSKRRDAHGGLDPELAAARA